MWAYWGVVYLSLYSVYFLLPYSTKVLPLLKNNIISYKNSHFPPIINPPICHLSPVDYRLAKWLTIIKRMAKTPPFPCFTTTLIFAIPIYDTVHCNTFRELIFLCRLWRKVSTEVIFICYLKYLDKNSTASLLDISSG